jgi:predicted secreted protein
MAFLYGLFSYIGYFFIMIACMVGAIITAKYKFSWAIYSAGAVLQLVALIGNQMNANIYGDSMVLYWIIYFALLIVSAVTIVDRHEKEIRKPKRSKETSESYSSKYTVAQIETSKNAQQRIELPEDKTQKHTQNKHKKGFFHSYTDMWKNSTNMSVNVTRSDFVKAKVLNTIAFCCFFFFCCFVCWCADELPRRHPDNFWEYLTDLEFDDEWYVSTLLIYFIVLFISHLVVSKLYTAKRIKSLGLSPWLTLAPLSFFVCFSKNNAREVLEEKSYTIGDAYVTALSSFVPFVPLYFSVLRKINNENSKD